MKYIHKYVKNRKEQLVGCVVAVGNGEIGWSMCNFSQGDTFSKQRALDIALGRAYIGSQKEIPHTLRKDFEYMKERSVRYFKQNETATVE
jgi:hypothetical protein